jgi:hypothetical protein
MSRAFPSLLHRPWCPFSALKQNKATPLCAQPYCSVQIMLRLLVISLDSQGIRAQPPLEQGWPRSATSGCRSTPTYQKGLAGTSTNRTLRIRVGPNCTEFSGPATKPLPTQFRNAGPAWKDLQSFENCSYIQTGEDPAKQIKF